MIQKTTKQENQKFWFLDGSNSNTRQQKKDLISGPFFMLYI